MSFYSIYRFIRFVLCPVAAGRYAYDDDFIEVADKVELCALPAAIYDAYQHVLPKRRPKFLPEALIDEENEEGGLR